MAVPTLVVNVVASIVDLVRDLDRASQAVRQTGTDIVALGAGPAAATDGLAGKVGVLSGAIAALGAGAAIKNMADYAGTLVDLSAQTGISIEGLQRLNGVAIGNGTTIEAVARAVGMMSDRIAGDDKSALAAIDKLGLSADALQKMGPEKAFLAIATEIAKVPDPMERTSLALDIFGKTGQTMLPLLRTNVAELAGGVVAMKESSARSLDETGDAFTLLMQNVRSVVGTGLGFIVDLIGPTATAVGVALGGVVAAVGLLWPVFSALIPVVTTAAGVIGGALVTAFGLLISPIGLVVAAVVGLIAIWVVWGDDIKRIVTETYGVVKLWVLDKFDAIKTGVDTALKAIAGFYTAAKTAITTTVTTLYTAVKLWMWDKPIGELTAGINLALAGIQALWEGAKTAITLTVSTLYAAIKLWLWDTPATALYSGISAAIEAIKTLWSLGKDAIVATVLLLYDGLVLHLWTNPSTLLKEGINAAIEAIKTLWTLGKEAVIATALLLWEGLRLHLWTNPSTLLRDGVSAGIELIKGLWVAGKDAVIATAKLLYEGVKNWLWDQFASIVNGVKEKLNDVKELFTGLYRDVVGQSIVPDMVREVGEWFERMGELMDRATYDGMAKATRNMDAGATTIRGTLQGLGGAFNAAFGKGGSIEGIMDDFNTIWGGARGIFGEGGSAGGTGAVGRFLSGIADMIEGIASLYRRIEGLIAIIRSIPPIGGVPGTPNTPVPTTPTRPGGGSGPPAGFDGGIIESFAFGSGGVRDFGRGTLAMLHGREAVVPEGRALDRPIEITIINQLDGQVIDRRIIKTVQRASANRQILIPADAISGRI